MLIAGAVAACLALVGYTAAPRVLGEVETPPMQPVLVANPVSQTAEQALTLHEAWRVVFPEGQKWDAAAGIVSLQSLDLGKGVSTDAPDAGADGRRAVWLVTFTSPTKPNRHLLVRISNRTVEQVLENPGKVDQPAIAALPTVDSPAAIVAARRTEPTLGPRVSKGNGYAFELSAGQNGKPVVTVIGSLRDNTARVEVDATSGVPGETLVSTFAGGGALYSADGGTSWQASSLTSGAVLGIAPVPGRQGRAFAVVPAKRGIQVHATGDGGRTWALAGTLPDEAGPWAFDISTIPTGGSFVVAVGTHTGVWLSRDASVSWSRSTGLPTGPAQWLAASSSPTETTLIVSISYGDNAGVYASTDLQNWRRLLTGVYRLSSTDEDTAATAVSERGDPTAYHISGTQLTPLSLSMRALVVAGTTSGAPGVLLASGAGGLQQSTDGGRTWTPALSGIVTALAIAPQDSAASTGGGTPTRRALAADLGRGILRSEDGGRTWL